MTAAEERALLIAAGAVRPAPDSAVPTRVRMPLDVPVLRLDRLALRQIQRELVFARPDNDTPQRRGRP